MFKSKPAAAWRDALAERPFAAGTGGAAGVLGGFGLASEPSALEFLSAAQTDPAGASRADAFKPPKNQTGHAPPSTRPAPRAPKAPAPRRALLAGGPASSDLSAVEHGDDEDKSAVDARPRTPGRGGAAWTRTLTRPFPLFRPPRRDAAFRRSSASRRPPRRPLLSRMLGPGALRPPPSSLAPPDLSKLRGRMPLLLPNGAPVPARAYELDRIEALDPRRAAGAPCRRRAPHWDGLRWHDGPARGLAEDARWLWLWKGDARWWASREPDEPALVRHRELWWSKQKDVWFALHGGELWMWRRFSQWDAEGLMRLADGVQLLYSADFKMVAAITPGSGAVLYDAATGAELGEWLESEMPRRRPPASPRLPSGI